jgi:hypothetical protein
LTGIRDLEHVLPLARTSQNLYHHIGTHVLSLVLVSGSYFRHLAPGMMGRTDSGVPVDVRHLFDPRLLEALLLTIFNSYFKGFTEHAFQGPRPFDTGLLTDRLIDAMGRDDHMEEIIRGADMAGFSHKALTRLLSGCGYSGQEISRLKAAGEDVTVLTGPHLGAFNRRISVPELMPYLGACAAICVGDRFRREKGLAV